MKYRAERRPMPAMPRPEGLTRLQLAESFLDFPNILPADVDEDDEGSPEDKACVFDWANPLQALMAFFLKK